MGKYDPWHKFFESLGGDEHRFSLERLEMESGVELPPSARKYDTWWSKAQYYAIWADHGWSATPRLSTDEVIFRRAPSRKSGTAESPNLAPVSSDADLILIGCVATKIGRAAPAKDLYASALWNRRRRYAEASGKPWGILSAEYGLVEPDEVIEPYDRSLGGQPYDYRVQWSRVTADAVLQKCQEIGATSVEIHAGKAYIEFGLESQLERAGIQVLRPLQHLRQGEQLAWYDSPSEHRERAGPPQAAMQIEEASAMTDGTGIAEDALEILERAVAELRALMTQSTGRESLVSEDEEIDVAVQEGVVAALLAYGAEMEEDASDTPIAIFTPNEPANEFLARDSLAFLVAVISDYQVKAERAWELPYALAQRLGEWSPEYLASHPDEVESAFRTAPVLHRFPTQTARWVVDAAQVVVDEYGGDPAAIWDGAPPAAELQERFRRFSGISQKKAAMAVEILERDLGVPVSDLHGSDIAYDIHIRRVFLRTGLADRDDVNHMVDVARRVHPERPGALDLPAWAIGRTWCRPTSPACDACPIGYACPQLIRRGSSVAGA